MPSWKTFVGALTLVGSVTACAHHHDGEVVPEHERAELLKKWDQEVCLHVTLQLDSNSSDKYPI